MTESLNSISTILPQESQSGKLASLRSWRQRPPKGETTKLWAWTQTTKITMMKTTLIIKLSTKGWTKISRNSSMKAVARKQRTPDLVAKKKRQLWQG